MRNRYLSPKVYFTIRGRSEHSDRDSRVSPRLRLLGDGRQCGRLLLRLRDRRRVTDDRRHPVPCGRLGSELLQLPEFARGRLLRDDHVNEALGLPFEAEGGLPTV